MNRVLFLVVFWIVFLTACSENVPRSKIPAVRAIQIKPATKSVDYVYAGVVKAKDNVAISFRTNGKIIERNVDQGDVIHTGQLLAKLDTKDLLINLENKEAKLEEAKTNLAFLKSQLNRYEPVYKKGYVSANFFQEVQTNYQATNYKYEQAKSDLENAKQQLSYANLYSDYEGVVTSISASAGQVVAEGQTVMEIAASKNKEIIIQVPEQRIRNWANIGKIVVSLWAYPNKIYYVKVREVAAEADAITRTYLVKLAVTNPDEQMRLGMTASVLVEEDQKKPEILLPLTAIQYEGEQSYVWLMDPKNMTVSPVAVNLGDYIGNQVIIESGLKIDQWVAIDGIHYLIKGQKIRLIK